MDSGRAKLGHYSGLDRWIRRQTDRYIRPAVTSRAGGEPWLERGCTPPVGHHRRPERCVHRRGEVPSLRSRPAQPRPRICSRVPSASCRACGIIQAVLPRAQPDPRPSRRIRALTPRCRRRSLVRRRVSGYVAQDCERGRFSMCAVAPLACCNLLDPAATLPHWLALYPLSTPGIAPTGDTLWMMPNAVRPGYGFLYRNGASPRWDDSEDQSYRTPEGHG